MSSEDQSESTRPSPIPQQRPRFIRAITSPLPALGVFAAQQTGDAWSSSTNGPPHPHDPDVSCLTEGNFHGNEYSGNPADQELTDSRQVPSRPTRPRPQVLQPQHDIHQQLGNLQDPSSLRSFSSSILSTLLPSVPGSVLGVPAPPASPMQPRRSITETLINERRWSRGQTLNWMPGFTRGHFSDGLESHPSPITANEASSGLKPMQRLCLESTENDSNRMDSYASLGLDTVSVAGDLCRSRSGQESSLDQLKVSEARTRRVSESGQGASSSQSSSAGFADRLSGFAQSMRGRPPFIGGNPTPPTPFDSSDASPAKPKPTLLKQKVQSVYTPKIQSHSNEFKSWEEFLKAYGQGHFSNEQPRPQPCSRLGSDFPPFPAYVEDTGITNPPPFLAAPIPPTEEKRLKALYSLQILGTGTDVNFQRVARLVATILGVERCMICLVDRDQISVKATHRTGNMGCPRELSLSGHAVLRHPSDPLVVLDASQDWRFKSLPTVTGDPKVRFYAGAALATSDGLNIGTLCVIDSRPRTEFPETEKMLLVDFASVVMREMELWNDQVQLCTRTRMMRDITSWVRGCLDMPGNQSTFPAPAGSGSSSSTETTHSGLFQPRASPVTDGVTTTTISDTPAVVAGPMSAGPGSATYIAPPSDQVLPTPTGSPTLFSNALGSRSSQDPVPKPSGGRLQDVAFPSACNMIQATMNVDAVYLVQASANKSFMPLNGSNVVWNYLGAGSRATGSVGTAGGAEPRQNTSRPALTCLASSKTSVLDESVHMARRQGDTWICNNEGCRPHRLGDVLHTTVEPDWDRDLPIVLEMLSYVRQEKPVPVRTLEQCPLFSCSTSSEVNDFFRPSKTESASAAPKVSNRSTLLCHTFQGTLPELSAGSNSPYKSCVVIPIRGASSANRATNKVEEPWAYFVVLSSSHTKQFSVHERIYLKNFGSCLVTEVLKRRVEAADKAKGVFIKSISHELRTPLHIILGILELLYTNADETLNEHQLSLIASAEASGKILIDTINNIIDLADLDPDNSADLDCSERSQSSIPSLYTQVAEIDIRELCEQVAGTMAKSCIDKNLVVVPSWTKPSLATLLSSASTSAPNPNYGVSMRSTTPIQGHSGNRASMEGSANGDASSIDSYETYSSAGLRQEQKIGLELMVAMDEPEKGPDQEAHWNFMLNVPVVKRILTQLLENALKFTTTGFVEISAVSPPLATFPLKPPLADSRPVLFTVRDTGKGISPEYVDRQLFQRFSQEDPLQAGTGLGLALVKLLVESLGGWLEIWSEGIEGKGCVARVLIWAKPSPNVTKSLRDEEGVWQERSCRFYTGDATVSTDRLWKIMGERIMGQDLNMNVERGNEQDISPEDMLKDLNDQSRCELLIFNDDLPRLKAYLSHWADQHAVSQIQGVGSSLEPVPLLMLTSISSEKKARNLVEAYKRSWYGSGRLDCPTRVVLMPKPTGPLKLLGCLRNCFATDDYMYCSPEPMDDLETTYPSPTPLLRSTTVPHITTMTLGIHDTRTLSVGTMIKPVFKFPTSPKGITTLGGALVPLHSPGGLVLAPSEDGQDASAAVTTRDKVGTKPKPQRSIRNFVSQRQGPSKANVKKQGSKEETSTGNPTNVLRQSLAPEGTDQLGVLKPVPRVLIVEDNMTNRMILRTFLKKRGVSVVEAENGKLGVERFQEEVWRRQGRSGFEFVLMDLQMPVMDGNLATKRIREFEQSMVRQHRMSMPEMTTSSMEGSRGAGGTNVLPDTERRGYRHSTIFALTGLAGEEDKQLAFECGVDGYLTKPVSLTENCFRAYIPANNKLSDD
ncbi:His Kinase A domain containing protein [Dissophora ornata]|nr:His Kinase A domain containing protein [Dissophora ornata]